MCGETMSIAAIKWRLVSDLSRNRNPATPASKSSPTRSSFVRAIRQGIRLAEVASSSDEWRVGRQLVIRGRGDNVVAAMRSEKDRHPMRALVAFRHRNAEHGRKHAFVHRGVRAGISAYDIGPSSSQGRGN